jgi:uncharacterized protein Smg (DUF494 family)
MNDRIKEIIAYLIDPDSSELRDPAMLHHELETMGYSPTEIGQAIAMLEWDVSSRNEPFLTTSTRILGEPEKQLLSTAAQGFLLRLYHLGWISEAHLNLIIENAGIEFVPPVSIEEVREIASRFISDLPDDIPSGTSHRGDHIH